MEEITNTESLTISENTISFFDSIRKWTKFFAILGYIGIGGMVIMALFASTIFSVYGTYSHMSHIPSVLITVVYLVLAVVYVFPITYLNRFSNFLRNAVVQRNTAQLENAFKNLKAHFKFNGILIIVIFGLYFLGIIAGIVFFAAGIN